jgi:uncharacterized protein
MKTVVITNENKAGSLLVVAEVADTFFLRLKGLLGRSSLPSGRGIIIKPANSIHTIGMKFAIDVIYVDRHGTILKIVENMPPGKIGHPVAGCSYVIETEAGETSIKASSVGDKLNVR